MPVAVPAELPVRSQGPPEAGDRLGVVAELTVRVAEAVPRQRLAVAVADGAVEVQGLLNDGTAQTRWLTSAPGCCCPVSSDLCVPRDERRD